MDESRLLARLDRIDLLDRGGAAAGELLTELRGLLREAEEQVREDTRAATETKEVVERLRTARATDIIEM